MLIAGIDKLRNQPTHLPDLRRLLPNPSGSPTHPRRSPSSRFNLPTRVTCSSPSSRQGGAGLTEPVVLENVALRPSLYPGGGCASQARMVDELAMSGGKTGVKGYLEGAFKELKVKHMRHRVYVIHFHWREVADVSGSSSSSCSCGRTSAGRLASVSKIPIDSSLSADFSQTTTRQPCLRRSASPTPPSTPVSTVSSRVSVFPYYIPAARLTRS